MNVVRDENTSSERGLRPEEFSDEAYEYSYDTFKIEYLITDTWEENCNIAITIKNISSETLHNWCLGFASEDEILNLNNATMTVQDSDYRLRSMNYNKISHPKVA